MKNPFSNKYIIIIYFSVLALIGLFMKHYFKKLLNKYDIFTIITVDSIAAIIIIISVILFQDNKFKQKLLSDYKNISRKDLFGILLTGIYGLGSAIIGTKFILANSVSNLMFIDILIGIITAFIGMHLFENKSISIIKYIGAGFILLGGYLLHK